MSIRKKQIRPLARLHGYWLYRGFLERASRWDLQTKRGYVLKKLKETLVRAAEGVPFYQRRFKEAGFDPARHFKSERDLECLPLLTKEEVRTQSADLIDRRFMLGSVLAYTSGTSGQPTCMRLNESYVALDYACMFRHWAKAGYTFRAKYAAIRSYVPPNPGAPLWKYNYWQNTLYMSAYHLSPATSAGYVEALARFQPRYLRGYPSSLNVLAGYAYGERARFGSVRGVFTASETLLPTERATIEATFGNTVFDWYGMTEPAVVITEQADHAGMEVEWEYGFPEFLPAPHGAKGQRRLIATSLHNPVMPFIRYDTGDVVQLAMDATGEEPSAREDALYPRIAGVSGRKDDCLLAADGRQLPSLNFYSLLQEYTDVLRFQFEQPAAGRAVMRLSLRPGAAGTEAMLRRLEGELRRRLGPDFALTLEMAERFVCSSDGKTPTFIRTFRPTAGPAATGDAEPSRQDGWLNKI